MLRILLIITGSIAAYKSLLLIRQLRETGVQVTPLLTKGGAEFVTPLSVASLCEQPVYGDLFSLKDETEMGHIRLSREADLVLVAPASADILAKMATGQADDLASTVLLATDKPVIVAPAMNVQMWQHPATQRNITQLKADGIIFIGPESGDLACGETGDGRMAEVKTIAEAIRQQLPVKGDSGKSLQGCTAIITAGPTFEAIDPVRFLGNRSSGKQGYALAEALAAAGAQVTLVSGPTALPCPRGVTRINVESADAMLQTCEQSLPADIFIGAAAVSDWKMAAPSDTKLKKRSDSSSPSLTLTETPDILKHIAQRAQRPELVIGFAAETASDTAELLALAQEKHARKGCDWLLANNVSGSMVFGNDNTAIHFLTADTTENWADIPEKHAVASRLTDRIADWFQSRNTHTPPSQTKDHA